jgi:hypothetical protein
VDDLLVKRFALVLGPATADWSTVEESLGRVFGEMDYKGHVQDFDRTHYYAAEMGENLQRRLLSFRNLAEPYDAWDWKRLSIEVEEQFRIGPQKRLFNIDPGYMDPDKVVFPSTKPGPTKVASARGFWMDMQLRYLDGKFLPFRWTFPDLGSGQYDWDFQVMRQKYKAGLRRMRQGE